MPGRGLDLADPQANLLELGANSIELIRIVNAIENEYGARLKLEEIYNSPTVGGLADEIQRSMVTSTAATDRFDQALAKLKLLSSEEHRALLDSSGSQA